MNEEANDTSATLPRFASRNLAALAAPLGGLLRQAQLVAGSVVAIGWGRAVREVIRAGLPRMPGVLTVAATGSSTASVKPAMQFTAIVTADRPMPFSFNAADVASVVEREAIPV